MSKNPNPTDRIVAGTIASLVRAHPRSEELRAQVGPLHVYLRSRGLPVPEPSELERAVLAHRARLEAAAVQAQREAQLFSTTGRLRSARYRHGAAFCPSCGMYKDFRKECDHCHHLEVTA